MVASAERRRRYCTPHLSPYLQTAPTHTDFFCRIPAAAFHFSEIVQPQKLEYGFKEALFFYYSFLQRCKKGSRL